MDQDWQPMVWRNTNVKAKIVFWPHENFYSLIIEDRKYGPFDSVQDALTRFDERMANA